MDQVSYCKFQNNDKVEWYAVCSNLATITQPSIINFSIEFYNYLSVKYLLFLSIKYLLFQNILKNQISKPDQLQSAYIVQKILIFIHNVKKKKKKYILHSHSIIDQGISNCNGSVWCYNKFLKVVRSTFVRLSRKKISFIND